MKIVHIGKGCVPEEINSIVFLREAGHEVYVPGHAVPGTHEQLVRRIIDADEIHIWDAAMVFELGMVYFFSVHALHYGLGWCIRVFCDPDPVLPIFQQQEPGLDAGERPILLPVFVPPCGSGLGPCKECADEAHCDELRAKHNES